MNIEPFAQEARRKIVEIAHAMLAGGLSYIEGARQINRRWSSAQIGYFDPDIMPFAAIDSQTDALPVGDERQHWLPEALVKLQPEIDRAEAWAREFGAPACAKIISLYGNGSD